MSWLKRKYEEETSPAEILDVSSKANVDFDEYKEFFQELYEFQVEDDSHSFLFI